ncbi:hypothetical protein ACT691_02065 [Vibrio metschnikovii]
MKLANYDGNAYAAVCKALVTKASVFIRVYPYMRCLVSCDETKRHHEGCIEQMQRLFSDKLLTCNLVPSDS